MRFKIVAFTFILIYSCDFEKNKINRDAKGFESIAGLNLVKVNVILYYQI